MKNTLYLLISFCFVNTAVFAQPKGANLVGVSSGYYNSVPDPTPNIWWLGAEDEAFNFSRGSITTFNFQRDMRISKRMYFSPSVYLNYTSINTNREDPNGRWSSFNRKQSIFGGAAIRLKRYIYSEPTYRFYVSAETSLGFSLFEKNNNLTNDLNGERRVINKGSIFRRNNGFFWDEQSSLGFSLGYEKQVNSNSFAYIQAGYSRIYNSFYYSWSNLNKHYYNIGVGIGFHKFKTR